MPRHHADHDHTDHDRTARYPTDLHAALARQRQDQLRAEADADRLARSVRPARRRFRLRRLLRMTPARPAAESGRDRRTRVPR